MKKKKSSNTRPKLINTRKAKRQNKRQQKKINRHKHYSQSKNNSEIKLNIITPGKYVKRTIEDDSPIKKKKPKKAKPYVDVIQKERQKEKKEENALKSQMEKRRREMLLEANEEEDKIIKKLEKQLGLNKTKNKTNLFTDDGLDYLLEICDRTTQEQVVAAEKHLADVDQESDFEEDLAAVTGKAVKNTKDKNKQKTKEISEESDLSDHSNENEFDNGSNVEFDDDDEFSDDGCSESEQSEEIVNSKEEKIKTKEIYKSAKNSNKLNKDDKDLASDDDDDDMEDESDMSDDFDDSNEEEDKELLNDNDDNITKENNNKTEPDMWEDIYGRKRDKDGNVVKEQKGMYIPPQFSNQDSATEKDLTQLKRHVKSVLNKLSGSNLHWASTTIETLYSENSRNSVNTALCSLWLDAIVQNSMAPDRLVTEYAALVAILQANVGTEIGAHFLQVLVKRFDDMMKVRQSVEDKQMDNLIAAMSHLYNFKIYHSNLLYDIFNRLLSDLTEKTIDGVLIALRTVGGVLRKQDPAALKVFIHDTQSTVANISQNAATGSRLKFLLEVLLAVKNNNLTKIPNYDPSYSEQLQKAIKGIIRKGNYVTALNIRLEDLLKAEERGKWWVVGSAWEGSGRSSEHRETTRTPAYDQKLLALAKKQRMNTEIRRSIFCIIMAAEDYMDAFEKLDHLGLKGDQHREIIHVLLACCLQEAKYNPYYAVLAKKLCDHDRKYQLSIQYTAWDKIKDIDSLSKCCMSNLAQFLTHLIMDTALSLSVLKIIEFSDLNKSTLKFMRQILLSIIMNEDFQLVLQVFQKVASSPKLHMFRESLRLFIQHFLVRNVGKNKTVLNDNEIVVLKQRTLDIDKLLMAGDSKLRF